VLHHLTLWVPDLERAAPSWLWLLGELGYAIDRDFETILLFRHNSFALVLEQSPDMVPGMLYSRLRPGLNHVAFTLESVGQLERLVGDASDHGWTVFAGDRHPIVGGANVAYLEDADGFEIELVAPLTPP
jgi:catechol 2,3-dioxygenase-like lactoylglutathione lyase family enzyme